MDTQTLANGIALLPQAITDFESEVNNARLYGYLTLGLLVYIAFQVSSRR